MKECSVVISMAVIITAAKAEGVKGIAGVGGEHRIVNVTTAEGIHSYAPRGAGGEAEPDSSTLIVGARGAAVINWRRVRSFGRPVPLLRSSAKSAIGSHEGQSADRPGVNEVIVTGNVGR